MGGVLKKSGLQRESLDQYLYARHAPERNRVMQGRYESKIQEIEQEAADANRKLTDKEKRQIKELQGYIDEGRVVSPTNRLKKSWTDSLSQI